MLDPADLAAVTTTFGVAEDQVRRDHMIGHVLAALSTVADDSLVFFGGTALTWTHLPGGRLSEDVDLYAADRPSVAKVIESELPRLVRRELPGTSWSPGLTAVRSTDPARLVTPDGRRLAPHDFSGTAPRDWTAALAHQTGVLPLATTCLERVLAAYRSSLGWSS